VLLSSALAASVYAATWPSLPTTAVDITVVDGVDSYFVATFAISPDTFDVKNGAAYPGWCIDDIKGMSRGVPHSVMLYSSLVTPLPDSLDMIDWNAINYILNHKVGAMIDVQQAIWYFSAVLHGGMPLPVAFPNAVAMINAANAPENDGYIPGPDDILAVICYGTEEDYQNCIIELVTPPEEKEPGLTPGFWKNNLAVYLGLAKGNRGYSDPTGSPTVTKDTMGAFFAGLDDNLGGPYDLEQLYRNLCPQLDGITADIRDAAANVFNVEAGLSEGPPWN